jgi:integrase
MGRQREGTHIYRKDARGKEVLYARVQWTDENGKRRQKEKRAVNISSANQLIKKMLREIDDYGPESLDGDKMTFAQLAAHYKKHHLVPAQYVDGRKVAGMRSLASANTRWQVIKDFFGNKKLRSITYGDLERFKSVRINTRTQHGTPRSITSVNRELEVLRNMLNVAYREGWILRNPFTLGQPIIQKAHEKKRERILTLEEEKSLLAACTGRRFHLRPIAIMALDTGMRRGEILTLSWGDVDLKNGLITVQAFHSKTEQERTLKMTPRLNHELMTIYQAEPRKTDQSIFGIIDNVKKSFTSACKDAGIVGARFHDLRHTFASRLIRAGVSQAEVSRLLGHNNTRTTDRYININLETAERAAHALASLHPLMGPEPESALVN